MKRNVRFASAANTPCPRIALNQPATEGKRLASIAKPMQTGVVNGWRCRYDLQTGKFDVPALFSGDNAKAVVPE